MECQFCKTLSDGQCPARQQKFFTAESIQSLRECTPFSAWQTPANIARNFHYHPKHVLRMVRDYHQRIAAHRQEGRYYILQCSFEHFVRGR